MCYIPMLIYVSCHNLFYPLFFIPSQMRIIDIKIYNVELSLYSNERYSFIKEITAPNWIQFWRRVLASKFLPLYTFILGHTVAQLVETLRYKPEGRWFDSRWSSRTWPWGLLSFQQKWLPGIYSRCKERRCVGLTNLTPSCAACLEIWEPQPSGPLRICPGLYRDCCTFETLILYTCVYFVMARHL